MNFISPNMAAQYNTSYTEKVIQSYTKKNPS